MGTVRIIGAVPQRPSWTDRLSSDSWLYWKRLDELLRSDPKWEQQQVDSVSAESFRVLQHLPDPKASTPFQGRGLVVGYVQSGKTANYTAVAARAVDAGYRMVIVLSGIHDSLRNQTQNRLERELVGDLRINPQGLNGSKEWVTLSDQCSHPLDFEADEEGGLYRLHGYPFCQHLDQPGGV